VGANGSHFFVAKPAVLLFLRHNISRAFLGFSFFKMSKEDGLPKPKYFSRTATFSTASTFGNHYETKELLKALIHHRKNDLTFDADFATRVFEKCGYKKHSIALSDSKDLFRRFTRSKYLEHRQKNLLRMAKCAGNKALCSWSRPKSEITHLLWGTMTGGMHSPSIDVKLVGQLGLSQDVARASIEGMGCLTGFRLLNMAHEIAKGDQNARILIISADLRSALGNSMPDRATKKDIVSVALFRDAASACVVGGMNFLRRGEKPQYEILCGFSRVINDSHEAVDYFEDDEGAIRLHLSKELPMMIGKEDLCFVKSILHRGRNNGFCTIPPLCDPLNNKSNYDILCHTGGPKVLREVQKSLGVQKDDLSWSWDVMESHGNLSGASNLAVLHWYSKSRLSNVLKRKRSQYAICLSMGPGPCLEGVLLKSLHQEDANFTKFAPPTTLSYKPENDLRRTIHIIGGGIAGLALAAGLDPRFFDVKIFESSMTIREKGYGLAVWGSTIKILKEKLKISDFDYFSAHSMMLRREPNAISSIALTKQKNQADKGFMQRSHLLSILKQKVIKLHPDCVYTNHKCTGIQFKKEDKKDKVVTTLMTNGLEVSYNCDLLVGADGYNSIVRKYVALQVSPEMNHRVPF